MTEKAAASSIGCSDSVSVIIPVLNRAATIGDALRSALSQRTDFPFNVLVIDNRSTDGTSERIEAVASEDSRVIHIIPGPDSALGIGGCWNLGINHPLCGHYAVQLDSDDMYSGPDTLQRIVDVFRRERCAMVIGSYAMTDFDLRPIPTPTATTMPCESTVWGHLGPSTCRPCVRSEASRTFPTARTTAWPSV